MNLLGSCFMDPDLCGDSPVSYYANQETLDTDRVNVADPTADSLAARWKNTPITRSPWPAGKGTAAT
jgi:hypothetical protein